MDGSQPHEALTRFTWSLSPQVVTLQTGETISFGVSAEIDAAIRWSDPLLQAPFVVHEDEGISNDGSFTKLDHKETMHTLQRTHTFRAAYDVLDRSATHPEVRIGWRILDARSQSSSKPVLHHAPQPSAMWKDASFILHTIFLPERHPINPLHYILGCSIISLHISTLTTPHTASWIFARRAVFFPLVVVGYAWLLWVPVSPVREDQWGIGALLIGFMMRAIDHACFVPEIHVFRLVPEPTDKADNATQDVDHPLLMREPVPPPFTLAKAYWALSLFSSWRGIGWNFIAPQSQAARQHPYKRSSSRKHFAVLRAMMLPLLYLVNDATRTYMKYTAFHFFSGQTAYDDLTLRQTIVYSLCVVARVWWILYAAYVPLSIACVVVGGFMRWEGEFWSPWGWPPIFGGMSELWRYPGLSTLWSRTWNNGGRRWMHVIGWIGIGEKILRLPVTGVSPHFQDIPRIIQAKGSGAISSGSSTPNTSRAVSPSHPVPTSPAKARITPSIAVVNLIKSLIVFTLSALIHDMPALTFPERYDVRGRIALTYRTVIYTTIFFSIQPIALAAEAIIKRKYRQMKVKAGIARGQEPAVLLWVERAVGFAVVWYWIGWTSGWYVSGVARMRLYMWEGDEAAWFSLFGGLWHGKWWH